ncbi:MAG: T9SS C-terminal target domain-containing protein [Haliscomenobacteraceae bacterium CHB4]|nr:hypothetical protein [Saprospiraceae bacterium]MCE7922399.1 T9SS C-terminal target domain-containing protein [Haliscomenobacteraceae bacterium CHB4]
MIRSLLLSLCSLLLLAGSLTAQKRTCAANEVLARQLMEDPFMKQRTDDIERQTDQFIAAGGAQDRVVVTIPVVVHVVYYNSAQNISDSRILSQLQVLNDDFRRLNADAANTPSAFQGVAADCEVNFCLATQDPNGNATSGIQRRQTSVNGFSTNDAMKFYSSGGLDAWDRNKYLNLWVCDISGGILGYAQFPGGPANTDGVVCDYAYFGTTGATPPFDKGRTATHEVGHWLNCYHIWGDDGTSCNGTDQVSDTPNQGDENYGCPTFPTVSCSNGPNGDMFMNYMDYTDDACMNLFTTGQKNRMQALFASGGARQALLSSPGCQPPSGGSCGTPSGLSATNITQTSATLNWGSVSGATSYNLQWKLAAGSTWTTVTGLTGLSYGLTGLTAGTAYNYQVQAVCSGGSGNYSSAASFTTASGNCSDQYEANNTRNTAKVIPVNQNITAQIATSTDKDWNKFSNTSATRNIKVELTTLPADYDVQLRRGTSLLATSENAGTANELIIYNTSTVSSSYYAYVYGWNGAFSNTQCYTLRVSLSSSAWRTDGSTDGEVQEIEIPVLYENAAFGMFPNPANDQLTVEVPMENESDVQVAILDVAGKIALQQHRTLAKGDNRITLDVSRLPNGIYFVQLRNGEQTHTRKLTVQR